MTLEVEGLRFAYRRRATTLRDVTFRTAAGRTALLGPNGAGKSTLFKVITGQLRTARGLVRVSGVEVPLRSREASRYFGFMPQDTGVLAGATVEAQLRYSAWLAQVDGRAAAVERALEAVGLVSAAKRLASSLSGGERQRLGLAQAMIANAPVLLLDEPTAGLDPFERARFRELLAAATNSIVVVSTHLVDDLEESYDEVIVLDAGHVCFAGPVDEFLRLGVAHSSRLSTLPGSGSAEAAYSAALQMKYSFGAR